MINKQEIKKNEFIESVLNNLSDLNRNIALDKTLTYLPEGKLEELFQQFETLDSYIFNHKKMSSESLNRLDRITFVMSKITDLDFGYTTEVGEVNNHLDHIAFGLNLMRDRLQEKFAHFNMIKTTFNSLQDIYLFTDCTGKIAFANDNLHYLGIKLDHVLGKNIRDFIFSKLFAYRYGFDLIFEDEKHDLVKEFIDNEDAESILRISRKLVIDQAHKVDYYVYKIELMNRSSYSLPNDFSHDPNIIRTVNDLCYKSTNQKQDSKKILTYLRSSLMGMPNDPQNQQILSYIDSKI